jgi:hypothetical protein
VFEPLSLHGGLECPSGSVSLLAALLARGLGPKNLRYHEANPEVPRPNIPARPQTLLRRGSLRVPSLASMKFFDPGKEEAETAWERMRQACGASVEYPPPPCDHPRRRGNGVRGEGTMHQF